MLLDRAPEGRDKQKMLTILEAEFHLLGLQLSNYYVTYLWKHAEPEDDAWEREYDAQLQLTVAELRGMSAILALGTDATVALTGEKAGNVSNLWLSSPLMPKVPVLCGPSLSSIMRGTLGEWRLALQRWKEHTHAT